MKRWFNIVARQRSHELFTLNVLLATLLFAWLTEQAGLSMELGAFVAGMLISETEYRYQVEEDIKPFRDVLLGLFFVAIGTLLDLRVVADSWPQVLLFMTVPILFKFALVVVLVRIFGGGAGTAIRTGVWLAQAGEFGFVLLALGTTVGLVSDAALQPVLAAMLLSMLAQPGAHRTGQSDRAASVQPGVAAAFAAVAVDREPQPCAREPRGRLRLRAMRPGAGPRARSRERRLHRARPRPGPGPRGRGDRRVGGLRGLVPARDPARRGRCTARAPWP